MYSISLLFKSSRSNLTNLVSSALTNQQRHQLKVLNRLWKISKKAYNKVKGDPKQEGDLLRIKTKCEDWLVVIQNAKLHSEHRPTNTDFVIVACKL
jgi:hypothetical protein